jgi:hypothetical protein
LACGILARHERSHRQTELLEQLVAHLTKATA